MSPILSVSLQHIKVSSIFTVCDAIKLPMLSACNTTVSSVENFKQRKVCLVYFTGERLLLSIYSSLSQSFVSSVTENPAQSVNTDPMLGIRLYSRGTSHHRSSLTALMPPIHPTVHPHCYQSENSIFKSKSLPSKYRQPSRVQRNTFSLPPGRGSINTRPFIVLGAPTNGQDKFYESHGLHF